MHAAMSVLVRTYGEVYLHTQPASARAIKLYLEFGFRPELPQAPNERVKHVRAWQLVADSLGRSDVI